MTSWIDVAYIFVALAGIVLSVYVMQKTEHDRINKVDPPLLQWVRRLAFIIVALALCYSILDQNWHRSLPVLLLVTAGVGNLTVNALALHMRNPPNDGQWVMSNSGARESCAREFELIMRKPVSDQFYINYSQTAVSRVEVKAMDQG